MIENRIQFAPYLYIPGGVVDLGFYEKAFGAVELSRRTNEDGTLHVAELCIGDNLFHLHEEKPAAGHLSPAKVNGTTVLIGLFVEDVDRVIAQALLAGAELVSAAQTYDYGYRQASIKDPFGHTWLIEMKL